MFHPNSSHNRSLGALQQHIHVPFQQVVFAERKLEHINCVLQANSSTAALFIGDTIATVSAKYIQIYKIGAVLCCNPEASKNRQHMDPNINFKYLQMDDHPDYPIHMHFNEAFEFIKQNLSHKINVLVQCHAGKSRSASIVCSYLMKECGMEAQGALEFLRQKRPRVKPNFGFMKQLEDLEKNLNSAKNPKKIMRTKTEENQVKQQNQMSLVVLNKVKPNLYDRRENNKENNETQLKQEIINMKKERSPREVFGERNQNNFIKFENQRTNLQTQQNFNKIQKNYNTKYQSKPFRPIIYGPQLNYSSIPQNKFAQLPQNTLKFSINTCQPSIPPRLNVSYIENRPNRNQNSSVNMMPWRSPP